MVMRPCSIVMKSYSTESMWPPVVGHQRPPDIFMISPTEGQHQRPDIFMIANVLQMRLLMLLLRQKASRHQGLSFG
jgi:hypothetical protein